MDEDYKRAARLTALELAAAEHVLQLAKVVSVFDALVESGRMLEQTSGAPDQELAPIPDVDELMDREADMLLGEAVQILADFFELGIEGQALLHLIVGLEVDE